MKLSSLLLSLLVVGCADESVEKPSDTPPPPWGVPISGGTITVTRSNHVVIADPDRDRVLTVDLATSEVVAEIALSGQDEPGRVVEDDAGRLHVALRRSGTLLTLANATSLQEVARRAVCPEPRGVAFDAKTDSVHVACTTGELVTLPSAGGAATRTLNLDRDLRDIVVTDTGLVVTRFRTAEAIELDAAGTVLSRVRPPDRMRVSFDGSGLPEAGSGSGSGAAGPVPAIAGTAWRAVGLADGRVLVTHQRAVKTVLRTQQEGGYGPGCGQGPVEAAFSVIDPATDTAVAVRPLATGALPVDTAVNAANGTIAIAFAGTQTVRFKAIAKLGDRDEDECGGEDGDDAAPALLAGLGAPTSLAWTPGGELAVFYPELPALVVWTRGTTRTIKLTGEIGYDAGRALFHAQTSVGMACASCHPEGRDDGHVWTFDLFGDRRTQSLGGGILARAPYHWGGDMADLPTLMQDVFGTRMAGGTLTRSQKLSLGPWLDRIPAPAGRAVVDAAAVARGAALFEAQDTGCATCHAGPQLTNNQLVDVGTGGPIKVPSLLGVGARPPFMHTGCAPTLADRFTVGCGGGDAHGKTSHLSPAQLGDLSVYLETL